MGESMGYLNYKPNALNWTPKLYGLVPNQCDVAYCNPTMQLKYVKTTATGWTAFFIIKEDKHE